MAKAEIIWKDRRHFMWFPSLYEKYWLSNNRIYCSHGMLRRDEHECQLYRILDISLKRSFGNLLFRKGTIIMKTNDSSDSFLILKNIKNAREVKDMISEMVEKARNEKGMTQREIRATSGYMEDVDGNGHIDEGDLV